MKTITYALVLIGILSCSGLPLAERDQRQKRFVLQTKVKASTAYQRAIGWMDKNLLPLEGTSMEQLAPEGKIVLKTKSKCQVLSPEREAENRFVTYKLVLESSENKVDVLFEDLKMTDEKGVVLKDPAEQLADSEQVKKIEPCLAAVTNPLAKGIRQLKINWE